MFKPTLPGALGTAAVLALSTGVAQAQHLTISTGLPEHHIWTSAHMEYFADQVEEQTDITFTRYYGGELVDIGGERDALDGHVIDVAAPLLAPYHEGQFPLTDVTQLPVYETNAVMVTAAFQELMESDRELVDGKTFYDYELGDKDLRGWGLGTTAVYAISTDGEELREPGDFDGMPMRAGAALHTVVLEELGSTPVTIPAAEAYEAMSRGTIDGIILSVGDWVSYSMEELLEYTITDVGIGHWQSYLSMTEEQWDSLSEEQQDTIDAIALDAAERTAQAFDDQDDEVTETASADGAEFVPVTDLSQEMQEHIAEAARATWVTWIEDLEDDGHPARETARLWAELIQEHGGELPDGVAEELEL